MTLRKFVLPPPAAEAPAFERCEMCAERIGEEHGHVVNVGSRALMCVCRACHLLFTRAEGRYLAVPDRYRHDPSFVLAAADWEELRIPVRMAFFFHNSALGRTVAFYPSPGGATESELPLDTWERVLAANPSLSDPLPDVEALIVDRRHGGGAGYLVPIDACYRLTGLVRTHWKGFGGGQEAWEAIDSFFAELRERSLPVPAGDGRG
ncbi:DUF5947 family protein [Nonomuraea sp. NPDC046570]|uniref:DUF5947 family protein n=1 Tax=Nonomuraea sp. NPDC046570 TaxID=3155255 RepID=UPI0033FAB273